MTEPKKPCFLCKLFKEVVIFGFGAIVGFIASAYIFTNKC
jgi:hypothetical protein